MTPEDQAKVASLEYQDEIAENQPKNNSQKEEGLVDASKRCPECRSETIKKHSSPASFFGTLAASVAYFFLLFYGFLNANAGFGLSNYSADKLYLMVFLLFGLVFAIAAPFAAGFSAVFGKNRCKECGHRWRIDSLRSHPDYVAARSERQSRLKS